MNDLSPPIGGTTGLSHEHSESVVEAAMWFSELREPPAGAVPTLRERFGLSALEACEALAMARRFQINRRAFG